MGEVGSGMVRGWRHYSGMVLGEVLLGWCRVGEAVSGMGLAERAGPVAPSARQLHQHLTAGRRRSTEAPNGPIDC